MRTRIGWGVLLVFVFLAGPLSSQNRAAVAVPVPSAPRIDGVLDKAFWQLIEPVTGFLQRDPVDGAPASERTEVRIGFDENAKWASRFNGPSDAKMRTCTGPTSVRSTGRASVRSRSTAR